MPTSQRPQDSRHALGSCRTSGFRALMATQFLAALNDNLFKLIVALLAVQVLVTPNSGTSYISLAGALFVLPFVLFSPLAGYCSDRFSKTAVIRATRLLELAIMLASGVCLVTAWIPGLLAAVFLMGVQSALFSPAKYGILPEILTADELSRGNGYVQCGTFLAILFGTAAAGPLMALAGSRRILLALAVAALGLIGLVTSLRVPHVQAAHPNKPFQLNGVRALLTTLRAIGAHRELTLAIGAAAFFWFVGALVQMNTVLYAARILHLGNLQTGLLLTLLAVGIGVGSLLAGRLSDHRIELGLVPLGALGLALCAIGLGLTHQFVWAGVWMFGLGLNGGVYIVPIEAFIQHASPPDVRGSYLAATAFVTSSAMILASALLWLLTRALNADGVYLAIGMLSIVAGLIIIRVMPSMCVRSLNFLLTHSLYQVKVVGKEFVPASGGALLVCNHASYVDPAILLASIDRPIRFVMARAIYNQPLIRPVARVMRTIPIAPIDNPRDIIDALQTARQAVEQGELVCIFAEGGHTRTGQMLSFKKGLAHVMKDLRAPVIPVYLDQVWGSIFSYKSGRYFWKMPEEVPYPVTVCFGPPVARDATIHDVRCAVQELSAHAFTHRHKVHQLLHAGFIRQAKRRFWHRCMSDSTGVRLTYGQTLTGALALSERLKKLPAPTRMIGVLLPASVAGALTNIALLMAGKIPVNLNFTSSRESLASIRAQCNLETIITSDVFLKKLGIERDPQMRLLEEIKASLGTLRRLSCLLGAAFLPSWWLQHLVLREKAMPDDLATVMFSSGSTGQPKGVMLTHANIASNVEAVYDVFQITRRDVVLGSLPLFHSFGFTGTLWLPVLAGAKVVFHPNPLDASTIGRLAEQERATVMLSTPTFLATYLRKCAPDQFRSLRCVIVGAEKLRESLATEFFEKFGVRTLEGYGATELSPFAAVNIPGPVENPHGQIGHKPGTIGHPLPGVAVRIVDPDTLATRQPGEDGLLLVKGPNVMHGYLNAPEKTREVIRDGWYNTGDIARLDEDGFLTITDRLSRFSKIGGEMVPHGRVEDAMDRIIGAQERCCVVTSVSDEKRGERLVVLHTVQLEINALRKQLSADGLPALWIPKAEDFYRIDALPTLGSGKLDLKQVKERARALANGGTTAP